MTVVSFLVDPDVRGATSAHVAAASALFAGYPADCAWTIGSGAPPVRRTSIRNIPDMNSRPSLIMIQLLVATGPGSGAN